MTMGLVQDTLALLVNCMGVCSFDSLNIHGLRVLCHLYVTLDELSTDLMTFTFFHWKSGMHIFTARDVLSVPSTVSVK